MDDEPPTEPKADGESAEGEKVDGEKVTAERSASDPDGDGTGDPDGEERWSAFAPEPPRTPSRPRRAAARVAAVARHEWTLASLGSVLLAAVMTWPTLRHPTTTIPQDIWDPTLQAWQMAWSGHALRTDPAGLWHANAFYPERYSFAFSDTLLGYAPAGMIGTGPVAALVRYNIMYVLVFALAFFGAYALLRQLGAGRIGAAAAGAAFGYAPWRLGQAGHLHIISTGGIALALAMLARGHGWSLRDGYRPDRVRPGWAVAGWLVAAWQLSLGFGIGLPFAYALAAVGLVGGVGWLAFGRPRLPARLLGADVLGGGLFAVVGGALAQPYLKVVELHPYAKRSVQELAFFSPSLRSFFTAPPESGVWGELHSPVRAAMPAPAETALLVGFALAGLAAAGLVVSIWSWRARAALAAGAVVTLVLAMGTNGPSEGRAGYLLLYDNLPGFDGIRTPGRLVLWTTLFLAVLAAGAVAAFAERAQQLVADRVPGRPGPLLRLATLLPVALVLAEGIHATPHPPVPTAPTALRTVEAPLMVLPTSLLLDENTMLWTTDRFPRMVNGGSGFQPQRQDELRKLAERFPDRDSVDALRAIGVKTVVVVPARVAGTPYAGAVDPQVPLDELGVTREVRGDAIVYTLD
jgi:hypothetical protein